MAAAKADGTLAGDGLLKRAWDASIFVQKKIIRTGKCRWSDESTWERYRDRPGGARLNVRRIVDEDEDDDGPAVLDREPEPVRKPDEGRPLGRLGASPGGSRPASNVRGAHSRKRPEKAGREPGESRPRTGPNSGLKSRM